MNEIGIIIVRYHENLEYIGEIKAPYDVYLYNRHEDKKNLGNLDKINIHTGVNLNIIDMEDDHGREAGTYAYHMYKYYDSLNSFNIFLQGEPRDRFVNLMHLLNNQHELTHTHYTPLNTGPSIMKPKIELLDTPIEFEYLADEYGWIDNRLIDPALHGWAPYHDNLDSNPFNKFCNKERPKHEWTFGASGQFIVRKDLILRHPPEYYKALQALCCNYQDPLSHLNPERPNWPYFGANMMEANWKYVF